MKIVVSDKIYKNIRTLPKQARASATRTGNDAMVVAYWEILMDL